MLMHHDDWELSAQPCWAFAISNPALCHPLSNLLPQTGRMLPFQTDTFAPDDPAQLERIRSGQRVTGLYLGATAYVVDGVRWVVLDSGGFQARGPWLAYPLPTSYGEEHIPAIKSFESVWRMAAERISPAIDRVVPAQAVIPPPPPTPKPPARRLPRGVLALAGAVPLPGLEAWIVGGHQR